MLRRSSCYNTGVKPESLCGWFGVQNRILGSMQEAGENYIMRNFVICTLLMGHVACMREG
jgi:hypothetical protein